jgi:spermidine synthase
MKRSFLQYPIQRFASAEGSVPVVIREGLTETVIYMRRNIYGEVMYYRLLTNMISMSSTQTSARRYMKLFVYWPIAVHPNPRHALLISYGVGMTAKALTDTRQLETIDIVDISKDILDLSSVVFVDPKDSPLEDPRVTVHVEDGRFFLQTTQRRFDLITGEPPPPKAAGIVNLFTKEYFQLLRDRLADGGIATYWLPVHSLLEHETKAIIRAFCEAFEDCSLWGSRFNWMLVGTRGARGPVSAGQFARQWRDPVVGPDLRALGFELPEQFGALFLVDADDLRALTRDTPPLDDDHPKRLGRRATFPRRLRPVYAPWMDVELARERFRASSIVKRLWQEPLRTTSLDYFPHQEVINGHVLRDRGDPPLGAPHGAPPAHDVSVADARALASRQRRLDPTCRAARAGERSARCRSRVRARHRRLGRSRLSGRRGSLPEGGRQRSPAAYRALLPPLRALLGRAAGRGEGAGGPLGADQRGAPHRPRHVAFPDRAVRSPAICQSTGSWLTSAGRERLRPQ